MKIKLDQIEARLQALIEGNIARIFPVNEKKNLSSRLVAEMQANLQRQPDGAYLAPNLFTLMLHPAHAQILGENQPLLDEMASLLMEAGQEAGIRFPSPPRLRVLPDPQMALQECQILAQYHLDHLVDTSTLDPQRLEAKDQIPSMNAFLIVNGSKVYQLNGGVVNIGRSSNNQLVIVDLRVSRSHAQLRPIRGRYVIFDLDSTGGTFVNDKRVTQCQLHPGDVISLAGVLLIYGQDITPSADETQKLSSP